MPSSCLQMSGNGAECRSLEPGAMVNICMRKTAAAEKGFNPPKTTKHAARAKEHEQLYLVRKSPTGTTNGFRHHGPKHKRIDTAAAESFDSASATIDFSD